MCIYRFWKMATTFTGLKLQGQLGKFGRIEISDIAAYVELPDGKVLSGTEWGNMLLWDGGFIKVEISRKGKKYCHNVSILQQQIYYVGIYIYSLVNQTQLSAVLDVLHHQHIKEGLGTLAVTAWHLQECVQSQSDCSYHMTTVKLTARRYIRDWARYVCSHYACAYLNTCGI